MALEQLNGLALEDLKDRLRTEAALYVSCHCHVSTCILFNYSEFKVVRLSCMRSIQRLTGCRLQNQLIESSVTSGDPEYRTSESFRKRSEQTGGGKRNVNASRYCSTRHHNQIKLQAADDKPAQPVQSPELERLETSCKNHRAKRTLCAALCTTCTRSSSRLSAS